MIRSMRVDLIGPNQQENLPLQYLAAALERAGHQARLVRFNVPGDLERTVDEVVLAAPDVVGLGIAFQYAIGDYLQLARELRERGYQGHITCGGHVPTFCWMELLRDCPAIDTAVRHEGERTLVELVDRVAAGGSVQGLEGLVWRQTGEIVAGPARPPVRDLEQLAHPKRLDVPMTVGGVPIAFLLTARGCVGECAYCSIRAFGRDAGGPGLRLRDPHAAAEEAAALYHDKGVRVFFVQDDLFVLPNEASTIERMAALGAALRERNVDDAVFWIKGRPEGITPAVLQAARTLGAIHMFLGVESASLDRLRYLGRVHTPEDNRRAIALCREYRVKPSFNFMLFDPDCSLRDISLTLDLAEENLDLAWNVCRTEIYSGTRLVERLQGEGRLLGDYRSYGYRMRDERAEVMFRILRVSLHHRAFAFDSLLNKLISLSFASQLHEALFPGADTLALASRVQALLTEVHRDTVQCLREAVEHAAKVDLRDADGVKRHAIDCAMQINGRDLGYFARFDGLWSELHTRGVARLTERRAREQRA